MKPVSAYVSPSVKRQCCHSALLSRSSWHHSHANRPTSFSVCFSRNSEPRIFDHKDQFPLQTKVTKTTYSDSHVACHTRIYSNDTSRKIHSRSTLQITSPTFYIRTEFVPRSKHSRSPYKQQPVDVV